MKRRVAIIVAATGLLTVAGTAAARADDSTSVNLAGDTSGCIVLLPDAQNPVTVCLFPR